jgi:hypothetical protein
VTRRSSLRSIPLTLVLVLAFAQPTQAGAGSSGDTVFEGPITQKTTLFWTTANCLNGQTGYAYTNWTTQFQRTAGSNREIGKARWVAEVHGLKCHEAGENNLVAGIRTYYPRFVNSNDITWGYPLNWPATVPQFDGIGISHKTTYMYRTGHPGSVAQVICTNVWHKSLQVFDRCNDL